MAYIANPASGQGVTPVMGVTSGNVTLNTIINGFVHNGVTFATGDKVLVANNTIGTENGVYTVQAALSPVRVAPMLSGANAAGLQVFIQSGAGAGVVYVQSAFPAIVGTNSLTFTAQGAGVTTEYGEQVFGATGFLPAFANLVNGAFTIPTPGVWEVVYSVYYTPVEANETAAYRILKTVGGTVVPNSLASLFTTLSPGNVSGSVTQRVFITTTTLNEAYAVQGFAATTELVWTNGLATSTSKVSWNKISGQTAVSGETVDFIHAEVLSGQSANIVDGDHVKFDTKLAGNITLDTATAYSSGTNTASIGRFLLKAGKTYQLSGFVSTQKSASGRSAFAWFNSDANTRIGSYGSHFDAQTTDTNNNSSDAEGFFTPTIDTRVELRFTGNSGVTNIFNGNTAIAATKALIRQIGTTAVTSTVLGLSQTHTTGAVVAVASQVARLFINPAALLPALAITLNNQAIDGERIYITFGGTIASGGNVVTALTVAGSLGQTVFGRLTAPATPQSGDVLEYTYDLANTRWVRIN